MTKIRKTILFTFLTALLFLQTAQNAQAGSPKTHDASTIGSDFSEHSKKAVTAIALKHPALTVKVGRKVICKARVIPKKSGHKKILFQSLNPEIAKVSPQGVITGLKPGTATILCISASSPSVYVECKATVVANERQLTFRKYILNLHTGEQQALLPKLNGKTAKKNILFTSNAPAIATVDQKGHVTAVNPGTAIITASVSDNPSLKAECTIRVTGYSELENQEFIFVGASRTLGKKRVFHDLTYRTSFITKSGARISWFRDIAFKKLKKHLYPGLKQTAVICMGVNDMQNIDQYIQLCKDFMKQYKNTKVYLTTVTPVDEKLTFHTNARIRKFNRKLQMAFPDSVIDTYTFLKQNGYKTVDGVHYDKETYAKELNCILNTIS